MVPRDTPRVGTGAVWMRCGGARAVLVPYMTNGEVRSANTYWHSHRPGSSWSFLRKHPIGVGTLGGERLAPYPPFQ